MNPSKDQRKRKQVALTAHMLGGDTSRIYKRHGADFSFGPTNWRMRQSLASKRVQEITLVGTKG